jgi:hypothetical protein
LWQIDSAQARFQAVITELKEERATQRLKLETKLQAIHRIINLLSVQHALHRGLKSAVAALDALSAAKVSRTEGKKDNGTSDSQSVERSHEAPPEAASVGRTDQKLLCKETSILTPTSSANFGPLPLTCSLKSSNLKTRKFGKASTARSVPAVISKSPRTTNREGSL